MAYRKVTTYQQAFEGELGMKVDDNVKGFIREMEAKGHTEKSICFSIWKGSEKICAFKGDSRFFNILRNEIGKWSWPEGDPRWDEYWKRKNEEKKAAAIREEIELAAEYEGEVQAIEKRAEKVPKNVKGFVYFFQGECGGAIKIGYSRDPEKRLRTIQTGYPDTIKILLIIPGTEKTEKILHKQFGKSRLKGEWFRPDDYVIEEIKELNRKYSTSGGDNHASRTPKQVPTRLPP